MIPFATPSSGSPLTSNGSTLENREGIKFPIVHGIPRFVGSDNYAAGFGLEWTIHSKTQLDSQTGSSISQERLEHALGFSVRELKGTNVLEPGCGAGRFTELMVAAGADVHALDFSVAVEANRKNIGNPPNYSIAQASLLEPPFPPESFDAVICLGVIQHTPSPEESIKALWRMLKPGGRLVFDHYTWSLSLCTKLAPVYRLWIKRLSPEKARAVCDDLTRIFFPLHHAVRDIRPAQMLLSRISPCLVYFRKYPQLTKDEHFDFTRLDTFDHLADYYKHLRTQGQIRRLLEKLGAAEIHVGKGDNGVEARALKPAG